jgi:hypothetical protein
MMIRWSLFVLLWLSTAPLAAAQATLGQFDGELSGDYHAVVLGGHDLDGDGTPDLVVGSPLYDGSSTDRGRVVVYSGATMSPIRFLSLNQSNAWFGASLAWTDDYDSDGVPEIVVGAPYATSSGNQVGSVFVFSGGGVGTIHTVHGTQAFGGFGSAVAGGFDLSGDGVGDFAVGAPFRDAAGTDSGTLFAYDGVTAGLFIVRSGITGDLHGWSMANAGDVTGDGFSDLAVGSPGVDLGLNTDVGRVRVYRLFGSTAWNRFGAGSGDNLGYSVASAGDVDGDSRADVLAGAPNWDGANPNAGQVMLYLSGGGGPFSWTGSGTDDWFGYSVASIGDVDGDGIPEFAAGAPQNGGGLPGFVRVIDAATQATVVEVSGDLAGDLAGWSVSGAGDVNGDGLGDVVFGAANGTGPGGNAGWARVFSTGCGTVVNYCTPGTSASGCTPTLTSAGAPSASAPSGFAVAALLVDGDKNGLFFFGANGRQANPWGNGTSYQCVAPPVQRGGLLTSSGTPGSCDGAFTQDMNAHWQAKPTHNPGPGSRVQLQCWYRDPQNTSNQSTSLTDAIEILVCP